MADARFPLSRRLPPSAKSAGDGGLALRARLLRQPAGERAIPARDGVAVERGKLRPARAATADSWWLRRSRAVIALRSYYTRGGLSAPKNEGNDKG
ncbi:MAG TPA: hypothetical protein VM223_16455 [Planctomycetota bacterium]|nr:hypothetical protein [Planctomycetota bacterium]